MQLKYLLIGIITLYLVGCADEKRVTSQSCQSPPDMTLHCSFQNPEDMVLTPDERYLLVSEYGGMAPLGDMTFGQLSLFNVNNKTKQRLTWKVGESEWGDDACQRQPGDKIAPHGIDLALRDDGRWQLAVVNHLPRESVELFELIPAEPWSLVWKGCVDVEGQYYFNDVALAADGSFYASHMFPKNTSMVSVLWHVWAKDPTGKVMHWQPASGFSALEFTAGSFPNGVALDREHNRLVVNFNFGDETVMYDLATEKVLGRYSHNSPDNVVIKDGYVWVANHDHAAIDTLACKNAVNCFLPFSINQLSMTDLSWVNAYAFDGNHMGVGTVAIPLNGHLWIGSYHADRLAEVPMTSEP